jgi:hypothetical protein
VLTKVPHNSDHQYMKNFLLGLIAVAAFFLPLGQHAQAHWAQYGYQRAYWHHGYWYGGYWDPGYIVVAPQRGTPLNKSIIL